MRTRLKLNPGQRGTKKLVTKYGERLICVRYRYDDEKKKRYKTVELVEEVIVSNAARMFTTDVRPVFTTCSR